jgi:hypothetical protein
MQMRHATQTTQVFSPFGGGYVPELRADQSRGNLPSDETSMLDFGAILKALRAALFVK